MNFNTILRNVSLCESKIARAMKTIGIVDTGMDTDNIKTTLTEDGVLRTTRMIGESPLSWNRRHREFVGGFWYS